LGHRVGSGVNLAVVRRSTSLAALERLVNEVGEFVRQRNLAGAWGTYQVVGVVGVLLHVRDADSVRALADRFPGQPICVEGRTPDQLPAPGPQPPGGLGWRLLADQATGERPYSVSAAEDEASYAALWARLRLAGDRPPVEFDRQVVVHFGPAVSGTCPQIRLDQVVIALDPPVVHPRFSHPGSPSMCTADARPHTYLVALERSALPGRFALWLDPDRAAPQGGDRTEVDLTN